MLSFFLFFCLIVVNSAKPSTFSAISLLSFKMDCQIIMIVFKLYRRLKRFSRSTLIESFVFVKQCLYNSLLEHMQHNRGPVAGNFYRLPPPPFPHYRRHCGHVMRNSKTQHALKQANCLKYKNKLRIIFHASLFYSFTTNEQYPFCPPPKLCIDNRVLSTVESYEAPGSVTLAMKSGTLLKSSTITTKNGWSTWKTTGLGSWTTALARMPIAVE